MPLTFSLVTQSTTCSSGEDLPDSNLNLPWKLYAQGFSLKSTINS